MHKAPQRVTSHGSVGKAVRGDVCTIAITVPPPVPGKGAGHLSPATDRPTFTGTLTLSHVTTEPSKQNFTTAFGEQK